MVPQLDLKRLRLMLVLSFFLGILASVFLAPLAVGIYGYISNALHISTFAQSEAFGQALFALIAGFCLIVWWIIISLYEKDPSIQEIRGKPHFPAISPWIDGIGVILWGGYSLIRIARHIPTIWPDPAYVVIFGLFFLVPWCIDIYRHWKRQRLRNQHNEHDTNA